MSKPKDLRRRVGAPRSGQYQEIGPRGGKHGDVTVPERHVLQPTPKGTTSIPWRDQHVMSLAGVDERSCSNLVGGVGAPFRPLP